MNLKLDIVRLSNEDVVATSSIHRYSNHAYVTSLEKTGIGNSEYPITYYFYYQDNIYYSNTKSDLQLDLPNAVGDWYYEDSQGKFHKCNCEKEVHEYIKNNATLAD